MKLTSWDVVNHELSLLDALLRIDNPQEPSQFSDMPVFKKTWVLVANRVGADFYKHLGTGKGLELVEHIDHEEGRLKDSEIDTDQPGKAFSSHGSGSHAMNREESAHDRLAANFSRSLAEKAKHGRVKGAFDQLILVAEPRFLGMLRQSLDATTSGMIAATVGKDVVGADTEALAKHLAPHLAV